MVSDGGYASDEIKQLASSKNIKHVTPNMLGTRPDRFFSDFEVTDNIIIKCPKGFRGTVG